MTTTTVLDPDKLQDLLHRFVSDLGGTIHAGLAVLGHRLGLYKALADAGGPATSDDLAQRAGVHPRYMREWLSAQAAGGYVTYDEETDRFSLSPEQAFTLANPGGPAYLPGGFIVGLAASRAEEKLIDRFRTGDGLGWHEHDASLFEGTELFFRPSYVAHLLSEWIPALDGVAERLTRGARVADVGCGHGASTILMAEAFPASRFFGFDYHDKSVERARAAAREAGVDDRVQFEVAPAKAYPGQDYDFVTFFDCLHDMGDPAGAARHVHDTLAADGTWMVVEPLAGDTLRENLTPVGRLYYGASTMVCTPASRSQEVGLGLGAQAGPARLTAVMHEGGFTRVRRAAETPFNMVLEGRP